MPGRLPLTSPGESYRSPYSPPGTRSATAGSDGLRASLLLDSRTCGAPGARPFRRFIRSPAISAWLRC